MSFALKSVTALLRNRCCHAAAASGNMRLYSAGSLFSMQLISVERQLILPTAFASVRFPRATQIRHHGGPAVSADAPTVNICFISPPSKSDGSGEPERMTVDARVGESLLQVAHRHNIEVEGACEGVCACSTCHVILSHYLYDKLTDDLDQKPSEDEEDMLDMAFGLTDTSRLGCQVIVTKEMDGEKVHLPSATRNFYVDGHVPQPH